MGIDPLTLEEWIEVDINSSGVPPLESITTAVEPVDEKNGLYKICVKNGECCCGKYDKWGHADKDGSDCVLCT